VLGIDLNLSPLGNKNKKAAGLVDFVIGELDSPGLPNYRRNSKMRLYRKRRIFNRRLSPAFAY